MLPVQPLPGYRRPDRPRRLTRRQLRRMEGASLWLAMLMLLFVQPLFVEASEQQVAHGSGQLHFRGDQGREPAPVLATDYQVRVAGLLAETRLRQRFGNNSDQWQEGIYTFPLPENATVHAMTLTTAERVVVGEIREREEARREYEAARKQGLESARTEWAGGRGTPISEVPDADRITPPQIAGDQRG